ncbi:hypothetical protein TPY_0656 [Sulfobacillus acidophilus TPY]|uniref:SpoOB alpha-helical domain-containing protein n=1 Tax=Sulfobacillus acidophilus (strain ATCC 700253 / DSM 10332 / NAL) TaxID=679936 RepID=G8U0A4_SULAD|nr:hypothetical protein TPY_0656 [Sulfobacillus acidophilus TPY]AEW06446.1 hypothetical protein Sulac_2985 [Sulfobacillus acidophilus DSM 10332]
MRTALFRTIILLALGAAAYWVGRPWRLLALVALVGYVVQWTAFHHRRETIQIIRRRRHRLANQLQLVSGWLQLGAYPKAEESLAGLLDQEAQQSLWFRGLTTYWSYFFLYWDAQGEARGVMIQWSGLDQFVPSYRMGWILGRTLSQAMTMADGKILVGLTRQGFQVRVPGGQWVRRRGWQNGDSGPERHWRFGRRLERHRTHHVSQ